MHINRVRRETVLGMAHKFHRLCHQSTVSHQFPTISVILQYKNQTKRNIFVFIFWLLFVTVSGSTSPTSRRLEYPYSYDSVSKLNCRIDRFAKIIKQILIGGKISQIVFCSWSTDGKRWAWSIECIVNTIGCFVTIFDSTALYITVTTIENTFFPFPQSFPTETNVELAALNQIEMIILFFRI